MRAINTILTPICGTLFITSLYAGSIYTVPEADLPFEQAGYDKTVNIEINIYGNTNESIEIEETMTDDVHPYTERNLNDQTIRTRIIENDFVSVHILQTSPSEIGVFTEDLFTDNANEDIESSVSSLLNNSN